MTETKTTDDLKQANSPSKDQADQVADQPDDKPEKTPIDSLPEDIQQHIRELREEAKSNRITAREAREQLDKMNVKMEEFNRALEEKSTALEEYEKAKKEAQLAEASEAEKLQLELEELRKSLEEAKQTVTLREGEIDLLKTEQVRGSLTSLVDELINKAGYKYKPYQRAGLLQVALGLRDDGTFRSSEEVTEIVEQFLEENKESPPSPPGGGGKEKATQVSAVEEMHELVKTAKKRQLSSKEYERFNELQAQINKARGSLQ